MVDLGELLGSGLRTGGSGSLHKGAEDLGWYPVFRNRKVSVRVDGSETTWTSGGAPNTSPGTGELQHRTTVGANLVVVDSARVSTVLPQLGF